MGKSSSFKNSGSPNRAYPNEFEQKKSSGESSTDQKSKLIISLVQINGQVVSKTNKSDSISFGDNGRLIEVHTSDGRIGNIPVHDIEEVRNFTYSQAYISGLQEGNYQVKITLKK